jgi:hypothetical protein
VVRVPALSRSKPFAGRCENASATTVYQRAGSPRRIHKSAANQQRVTSRGPSDLACERLLIAQVVLGLSEFFNSLNLNRLVRPG